VTIDVRGTPRPQGSMQLYKNGGARYSNNNVYVWRGIVTAAVVAAQHAQFTGPVELMLGFDLPRIGAHYLPPNKSRVAPELRADAPTWPTTAPDTDKLCRAVMDANTDAGLWHDDAQVASLHAAKRYTDGKPGVLIRVSAL